MTIQNNYVVSPDEGSPKAAGTNQGAEKKEEKDTNEEECIWGGAVMLRGWGWTVTSAPNFLYPPQARHTISAPPERALGFRV